MTGSITSEAVRETFLTYLQRHGHVRIPPSPLVPVDDPTLLFVNSGMAPLKKYFTGEAIAQESDLCNTQLSIRTNGIENVGNPYHLTLFEMLGHWSINNYFKERAVELAFGLLVDEFAIPVGRILVSVFGGDPSLDVPPDDLCAAAWEKVGIPSSRVLRRGRDNFWGPAGRDGPCGPCTKVFLLDSEGRMVELWEAGVFMEFNKLPSGELRPLATRSVDAGASLETVTAVLNRFESAYETDLLRPIAGAVQAQVSQTDLSTSDIRILTDHIRTSVFILSEGVVPGERGRSHVPRRLIRKCLALVAKAGVPNFDYAAAIRAVVGRYCTERPALRLSEGCVVGAFIDERDRFDRILRRGLHRMERLCSQTSRRVSDEDAFELTSTYGLPYEIVHDFLRERGFVIEDAAFWKLFRLHQEASRAS